LVAKRSKWLLGIALWASVAVLAQAVPPGNADEIRERTLPFGEVCRAGTGCGGQTSVATGTGGGGSGMSGEQIYNQFCFACHATGVTDAPRLGNAEDWAPRIAKGMDALMASTIDGLNIMPAKGTCMACSDDELRAAVDYMVESTQ
jgi:cytochrome c5